MFNQRLARGPIQVPSQNNLLAPRDPRFNMWSSMPNIHDAAQARNGLKCHISGCL